METKQDFVGRNEYHGTETIVHGSLTAGMMVITLRERREAMDRLCNLELCPCQKKYKGESQFRITGRA